MRRDRVGGPDTLDAGRAVGPNTLTAGEIRPLVDGDCGIDISCVTQLDQNRHAESLGLRLKLTRYRCSRAVGPRR
jgi:hypothetical protein